MFKWMISVGAICGLLFIPAQSSVAAITYTGSISTTTGDLIVGGAANANQNWVTGLLSWVISQTNPTDPWHYEYTFTHDTPGTSHIILEVSSTVHDADILNENHLSLSTTTYSPSDPGNSNPSLPGAIYGVKFNVGASESGTLFTFDINRAPVWGDFYAKGGASAFAYNSGFLAADPTSAAANGALAGHILRPDSVSRVPEPASILAWSMIGLAFGGFRFYRRKSTT